MRVKKLIEIVWEYNELLKKIAEANIWFETSKASKEVKDKFENGKYAEVWKRIGELSEVLDKLGITYKADEELNEVMEGIELPKELKRDKVEGFLENWNRILKEKEKLKVGT